jgi:hypothetical protein
MLLGGKNQCLDNQNRTVNPVNGTAKAQNIQNCSATCHSAGVFSVAGVKLKKLVPKIARHLSE